MPGVVAGHEDHRAAALERVEPKLVIETDGELDGERVIDRGASPPLLPDDPERPVAIVFSSGTSGAPKPALAHLRELRERHLH